MSFQQLQEAVLLYPFFKRENFSLERLGNLTRYRYRIYPQFSLKATVCVCVCVVCVYIYIYTHIIPHP